MTFGFRLSRWSRRVQSPWVTAALILMLSVDAAWVSGTSDIVWPVRRFLGFKFPVVTGVIANAGFKRGTDGTLLLVQGPMITVARWFEIDSTWSGIGNDVVGSMGLSPTQTGIWAPTVDHYDSRLHTYAFRGPPVTASEREQARSLIADELDRLQPKSGRALHSRNLRQPENSNIQVPITSGYLHNTATLLVLAAFLWSLGWIPRLITARHRAKLRAAGLCPHCRYDMSGVPQPICPECGKPTG